MQKEICIWAHWPRLSGMGPVSWLPCSSSTCIWAHWPRLSGMGPVSWLSYSKSLHLGALAEALRDGTRQLVSPDS